MFYNSIKSIKIIFVLIILTLLIGSFAEAQVYYIDPDHPSASNSNNGTSASTPWANWEGKFYSSNTTISAGDIIYIAGGRHEMGMRISSSTTFSGVNGNPVYIRPYAGYSGDKNVIIDGNSLSTPGLYSGSGEHDYVTLYGNYDGGSFRFTDCSPWGIQLAGSDDNGHEGWVLKNFTINYARSGIRLGTVKNTSIQNFFIHDLFSVTNSYDSIGIALRNSCDNITIENGSIYRINDTRGGDGDADGIGSTVVSGEYGVRNAIIRNVIAYLCGEDGIDVRPDQSLVLENIITHHNAICGLKIWETANFTGVNILSYGNGESGLKIDRTVGDLWHVTSVGNYRSGVDLRYNGSNVNIYNSLFAYNKLSAFNFFATNSGTTHQVDFTNCLFYQDSGYAVITHGESAPDWSHADIINGTMNTDLGNGVKLTYDGYARGSATNCMAEDPGLKNIVPLKKFIRSVGAATLTTSTLEWNYESYPSGGDAEAVGDFIESDIGYGYDGVLRQLTNVHVDSEGHHVLTFANDPFASTPNIGSWIINYGPNPPANRTFDIEMKDTNSAVYDAGVYNASIHNATPSVFPYPPFNAANGLLNWSGSAPDIGAMVINVRGWDWIPPKAVKGVQQSTP